MVRAPGLIDRLVTLLEYPDGAFASTLAECCAAVKALDPVAAAGLERFALATQGRSTAALQELYVATFDLNPRCTLDLGWHLFGEAYERGALLSMLREELQRERVPENGELPDHLPAVLMLLNRLEPARRAELTRMLTPALDALRAALVACDSPYAPLLNTVVTTATAGG
jgi:nitrate reductase delta subunit